MKTVGELKAKLASIPDHFTLGIKDINYSGAAIATLSAADFEVDLTNQRLLLPAVEQVKLPKPDTDGVQDEFTAAMRKPMPYPAQVMARHMTPLNTQRQVELSFGKWLVHLSVHNWFNNQLLRERWVSCMGFVEHRRHFNLTRETALNVMELSLNLYDAETHPEVHQELYRIRNALSNYAQLPRGEANRL